ncbi:MAG: WYL domain-containing protein [Lachnospiraceae bacterium]|nr:WYL domain-containing protein [Lachnospiraceae bacterium]
MPKGTNQKLKLYYLSQIMTQKTDDEHMLTLPEIQEHLLAYDVTADRKSLYDDMEALRVLGIDVIGEKVGRNYYYHVGSKQFDIAELKLLVDAIQSSKFITEKKSNELIKKITGLASEYEASQLKRTVTVQGRVKTMNESIYYIVDDIHRAIAENKQIRFEYMKWTTDKKLVPRRDEPYVMSPWALTWDDENYYLIAYDETGDMIRHFRVDKMKQIELLNVKRAGKERFREFDLAEYSKMSFGMFAGEKTRIKLEFKDEMVGVMIDRFGKDIPIRPGSKTGWSETSVDVALSNQFFGWLFGLGSGVRITGPSEVVETFRKELKELKQLYSE